LYEHVFDYISIRFTSNNITNISSPIIENSDIANQIESLLFSALSIIHIAENAFDKLPRLKYLEISGCGIGDRIISSGLD
jgi:hypothetical protein